MFDFLFGRRRDDDAFRRERSPDLRLRLDLDRLRLNDVGLGDRIDDLSFLGPPERDVYEGEHAWFTLGFSVSSNDERRIEQFDFYFSDYAGPEYEPFAGEIVALGRSVALGQATPETLPAVLGDPYWIDEDDGELLFFYEPPGGELQLEFDEEGRLALLIVTSDRLLADPAQREAYGVDKPWPHRSQG